MVSTLEHKLLLAFFALTLLFSAIRTSGWIQASYDRWRERTRIEQEREASGGEKIRFAACDFGGPRAYESIIFYQIIFLLCAFGCSAFRHAVAVVLSTLTLLLVLFGYFGWLSDTYVLVVSSDYTYAERPAFTSYLLYNSTTLDFVILFSIMALLTIHSAIIVRFIDEGIRARLGPR